MIKASLQNLIFDFSPKIITQNNACGKVPTKLHSVFHEVTLSFFWFLRLLLTNALGCFKPLGSYAVFGELHVEKIHEFSLHR